jgi:hypothetical protein
MHEGGEPLNHQGSPPSTDQFWSVAVMREIV